MTTATTEDYTNAEGIASAIGRSLSHIRPPEKVTPVEWAEAHVRIPAGNALPGLVRMRNAPFQAEPLNMIARPDCREITLMWSAQTGKTFVQLMAMGYFIDHDPQSQMMMQPSQGDLQTWLSAKFDPMVEQSEALSTKVAAPRSRGGVNNQRMKQYPGGALMFAWSGSPKTMRGRSAPKIFADEIDGYERTVEGDPIALIKKRSATFGDSRLIFKTSTPTFKGASAIESSFLEGDRRRWFVDCPHCNHRQTLQWSNVQWTKDGAGEHLPETARYVCDGCGAAWSEAERIRAVSGGQWIAERPFAGHASYHLPEMASLFVRLPDLVHGFLKAKRDNDMQTFVNVSLAETWDEAGTQHDPDLLYARREKYAAQVPADVCVLVAGVDVQDDRLEATVWGFGGENGVDACAITHEVFRGDPGQADLWDRLDDFLATEFEHETGVRLRIAAAGVDSGGHYTTEVYKFCKARAGRRVYALKGSNQRGAPIVSRPTNRNAVGVDLFAAGTDAAKDLIFRRLGITDPAASGYIRLPSGEPMIDAEFCAQLTAEKRVTTYKNGFPTLIYKKMRPRNEALDCLVYALVALEILRPNFAAIAAKLKTAAKPKKVEKAEPELAEGPKQVRQVSLARRRAAASRKKTNFVNRW